MRRRFLPNPFGEPIGHLSTGAYPFYAFIERAAALLAPEATSGNPKHDGDSRLRKVGYGLRPLAESDEIGRTARGTGNWLSRRFD